MNKDNLEEELKPYYEKGDCCSWIVKLRKSNKEKDKEIVRLNNIINELEKYVIQKETENNEILKNKYKVGHYISEQFDETLGDRNDIYDCILDKLKELKEGK